MRDKAIEELTRPSELELRMLAAITRATGRTRSQIDALLEQDLADEEWVELIGAAYTRAQVGELLGISEQAVAKRRGLLALPQQSGRIAYPVSQFRGRATVDTVEVVIELLSPVVATPWTTASWLASPHQQLSGHAPVDVLKHDTDVPAEAALELARRHAAALRV